MDERALAGIGEAEAGRVGTFVASTTPLAFAARVDLGRASAAASRSAADRPRRPGAAPTRGTPSSSSAASSAALRRSASTSPAATPPPCAKSGRPPPRRPSRFITSGAFTRSVSESETAAMTWTPSSATAAETRTKRPVLVPVAEVVDDGGVRLAVEALEAGSPDDDPADLHLVPARGPAARPWRASSSSAGSRARAP